MSSIDESAAGPAAEPVPAYAPAPPLVDLPARAAAGELLLCCDQPALTGFARLFAPFELVGWAYARSGVVSVWVVIDGRTWRQAVHGLARPNLVGPLARRDAGACAFRLVVDPADVPPGTHTIEVVALAGNGEAVGISGEVEICATLDLPGAPERPAVAPPVPAERVDGGGERFVPELHEGAMIEAEHETRYRWATPLAKGRDVLDAGCGVGWGSCLLAAAGASSVTGVDIHPQALENARERADGAAEFVQGDLAALPFDDDRFDVVVCFEAIEHVPDPERALDELRRVLRPDGLLLISSPNRGVYPAGNPHHLHEYTASELEASLRARFANVALHRQQTHVGSLIVGDDGFGVADAGVTLDADVRKVVGGAPGEELYTVAIAGDAELPPMPGVSVLTAPVDVKGFIETLSTWKQRALLADATHSTAQAELGVTRVEHEKALVLLQATERRRQDGEQRVAALEQQLAGFEQQLAGLERLPALERQLAAVEQARDDADRRRAEAEEALARTEATLTDHRGSLSWRITAPMRTLKRRLRAGLRGSGR